MLEGQTIHDPLLLYFIAVKRQPFLISGFFDTGEFVLFKGLRGDKFYSLKLLNR